MVWPPMGLLPLEGPSGTATQPTSCRREASQHSGTLGLLESRECEGEQSSLPRKMIKGLQLMKN